MNKHIIKAEAEEEGEGEEEGEEGEEGVGEWEEVEEEEEEVEEGEVGDREEEGEEEEEGGKDGNKCLNIKYWLNLASMLCQHLRNYLSIDPTLYQYLFYWTNSYASL